MQARVGDEMGGISRVGQVSSGKFMLPLGAGLDPLKSVREGIVDGLVITELKMQKRMVLDGTPVAAKQSVSAYEIDGARDPAAGPPCHDEQNAFAHFLA